MVAANSSRRPKPLRRRRGRRSGMASSDCGSSSGSGVESDNWRRELLHQAPEQGKGIDAGRMPTLEGDLQRVLTNKGHVADPQLVLVQGLDPGKPAWRAGLAATLSART